MINKSMRIDDLFIADARYCWHPLLPCTDLQSHTIQAIS